MAGTPPKKPLPPLPPPKGTPPNKPLPPPPTGATSPTPPVPAPKPPAKPLPPVPVRVRVTPEGVVVPPKGYRLKKARAGDCFCDFASNAGFKDCTKIRAVNTHLADKAVLEPRDQVAMPEKTLETTNSPNETVVKAVRVLYPCAKIRIIGNGSSLKSRSAPGLPKIGVSNYRTDKSSATQTGVEVNFFKAKGTDDDAGRATPELDTYADPDHFRIEIHDVAAKKKNKATITAEIQVLQPLYKRITKAGKTYVKRDTTSRPDKEAPAGFKIPTNAERKATLTLHRVGTTAYYRSRYQRLVTHAEDKVAGHTLYVGDYYDDGANDDEKRYTEILEQRVRVRYTPFMCTEKKCRVEAVADVGEMQGEIRLSVHVMDGACSNEDVRRVVYKQVRRTYASAHVRPYIKKIFRHPPPKNILVIGNSNGTAAPASGVSGIGKKISMKVNPSKIKVKVEGTEFEEQLNAPRTVQSVATAIRAKIVAGGFFVKELPNAYPVAAPLEPCVVYLVFKDAAFTDYATVNSATSDDTRLSVANWVLSSAKLAAYPHDGDGIFHRLLKGVCDTRHFDTIILKEFDTSGGSTLFGIATWWHKEFSPCIIVQSDRMTPAVDDRYTFSHEIGHVLCHGGHYTDAARQEQLMLEGGSVVGNAKDMPGRRRFQDVPMTMSYQPFDDAAGTWTGPHDLGPGKPHGTMVSRMHRFGKGPGFGPPTPEREVTTEW